MNRRNFLKVASVGGLMVTVSPSSISGELRADDGRLFNVYEKVQLIDSKGLPLKAKGLMEEVNYIFNY